MDCDDTHSAAMNSLEPDLQSSTMTGSAASDDSVSGNGGWLSDFKAIAWSLQQTAGGVASFVHRSAVAIADEIAQLEQEEMEKQHSESSGYDDDISRKPRVLPLPWEVRSGGDDADDANNAGVCMEDLQLKEKIQRLAESDGAFMGPFTSKREEDAEFLNEARITLVRRLLQVDEQLAQKHAQLSGRSDVRETLFWKNYFYHVEQTMASHKSMAASLDSLVPAEEEEEDDDDWEKGPSEFLQVPSPPTSMNSLNSLGVHSVDSLVVVDGPSHRACEKP